MTIIGINATSRLLRLPSGSPYRLRLRIQAADGSPMPLSGTAVVLRLFSGSALILNLPGAIGTDSTGDYALFVFAGTDTAALPVSASISWEIGNLYSDGKLPLLTGAVYVAPAAPAISGDASNPASSSFDTVTWAPGLDTLIVTQSGVKGDKGDPGGTSGPALLISSPLLSAAPTPPGIFPGTLGQFVGGTDGAGTLTMRYSNDTKGGLSYYIKTRAASVSDVGTAGAMTLNLDKIHTLALYGDGGQGYLAHIGQEIWAQDGASKGDPTELPGLWIVGTGTGLHTPGTRTAICANSNQQVFIAGPISAPPGPGVAYGGNLEIGVGSAGVGGAPIKFHLTGAVLLTVPEPGAFECDATGNLYFTNAAGVRKQVTLT